MARNPEHAQDKLRRGQTGSAKSSDQPARGEKRPDKETPKEDKREMQDPMTRLDPNCEGEYWDEEEESREKAGTASGEKQSGS